MRNCPMTSTAISRPVVAYCCPSRPENGATTSYLAPVGPGTAWPGVTPRHKDVDKTGFPNLALLVEVRDATIPWAEPRDFDPADLKLLGSRHLLRGFSVAMLDGKAAWIDADTPPERLRAMLIGANGTEADEP